MERLSNAPPEKRFQNPKSWLEENKVFSFSASIPGMGIAANNRNIKSKKATIKILFLISLILNSCSILFIWLFRFASGGFNFLLGGFGKLEIFNRQSAFHFSVT